MTTLANQLDALDAGAITATALLEEVLTRATSTEAKSVYTQLFGSKAQAEAEAIDILRRSGIPSGPLAGLPIAVKDLFDVAGEVTRAGSKILAKQPAAAIDAKVVRRLREAGAVITGHVNMTEFAYSGLGLNPHYGTPPNPFDQDRIPGGSSSGSAVAVALGMAAAALGTDTGGSVRIPAALCGLVGFKPTQARIPLNGVFPLSFTLDSVGPIARSVDCCARMDAVLSGDTYVTMTPTPVRGLRLAVPTNYVQDDLDADVSVAFDRSLRSLSDAGVLMVESSFKILEEVPELSVHNGGIPAAECYELHQKWITTRAGEYDPRTRVQIEQGSSMSAACYLGLCRRRTEMMMAIDRMMADWDALIMPTVVLVSPKLSLLEDHEEYIRINRLLLRNTEIANMLGLCAITLPCQNPDELPVGLTLMGRAGDDHRLLKIAADIEMLLKEGEKNVEKS
jgi:aspartyl-tRNA(Asn)/glutamyl-tRNA(Gln) amidotransferase subunit A